MEDLFLTERFARIESNSLSTNLMDIDYIIQASNSFRTIKLISKKNDAKFDI
jgi:hypothetical protein